jgi:hypothetical protein
VSGPARWPWRLSSADMIRRAPELGCRWYVRDADSGDVLGWFDYQVARWFADEQRQAGREVEIGYSWRSLWQPHPARQEERRPRSEPEAGA